MVTTEHLTDIIRNQQSKQHKSVEAQLHLDYARERQGLTLYLDQQLKQQLKLFQDQQEKINKENRR